MTSVMSLVRPNASFSKSFLSCGGMDDEQSNEFLFDEFGLSLRQIFCML